MISRIEARHYRCLGNVGIDIPPKNCKLIFSVIFLRRKSSKGYFSTTEMTFKAASIKCWR